MAAIQDVFHVSQLKKCIKVPTEIVETRTIEIEPDLSYTEQPIRILDTKERVTRRKKVKMCKMLSEEEATWETESYLQRNFPTFLPTNSQISSSDPILLSNLGMRFFSGGKALTFR
jgi:hypothetical protein